MMYPRDWKEQLLNVRWNTNKWELRDIHGVLAGAVEKEEMGMDGGNGSLIVGIVWAGYCLGCFLHHNYINLYYKLN